MKKTIIFTLWGVMFAGSVLSVAQEYMGPGPVYTPQQYAVENASFKHEKEVFNSKTKVRMRAVEKAEKWAAEIKLNAEKADDKGEGRIKVRF